MSVLEPLANLVSTLARSVMSDATFLLLSGQARWTILPIAPGSSGRVHGIVMGRRQAAHTGVVLFLALREDNTLRPVLLPVYGQIPHYDELDVRIRFVHDNVRMIRPRGHAFEQSPVVESMGDRLTTDPLEAPVRLQLCKVCALTPVSHERERFQMVVEDTLGTSEVRVNFKQGSAEPDIVYTRDPPAPPALPRVVEREGGRLELESQKQPTRREWRPLTKDEWQRVGKTCEALLRHKVLAVARAGAP